MTASIILENSVFSLCDVTFEDAHCQRCILTRVRLAQCVPSCAFTGHKASLPKQILVTSVIMLSKYAFSESAFAILARKLVYEYDCSWITMFGIVTVYATGALIPSVSVLVYACLLACPEATECLKVAYCFKYATQRRIIKSTNRRFI